MPDSLQEVLQGRLALLGLLFSEVPFCYFFCAIRVHPEESETEEVGTPILHSIMLRGRVFSGCPFLSVRVLVESISQDPLLSPVFFNRVSSCFLPGLIVTKKNATKKQR